jgi:hypothetical protein
MPWASDYAIKIAKVKKIQAQREDSEKSRRKMIEKPWKNTRRHDDPLNIKASDDLFIIQETQMVISLKSKSWPDWHISLDFDEVPGLINALQLAQEQWFKAPESEADDE